MRASLLSISVAMAGMLLVEPALGQVWNQNSGQSGMFGNRTVGSTLSAGTRTFSSNPAAGRTGTNAALGSSLGTGTGTSLMGSSGTVNTSARFVRGNRQPGEFVGAGSEEASNFVGAVQSGQQVSTGGSTALGRSGSLQSMQGMQRGTTGQTRQTGRQTTRTGARGAGTTELQTMVRVAFEYPKPTASEIGTATAGVLRRIPALDRLGPISVEIRGDTATLQGVVATEHDRDLARRLALLEPGIWNVNNDLQVASATAPSATAPPSAGATPPVPATAPQLQPGAGTPFLEEQLPLETPPAGPPSG